MPCRTRARLQLVAAAVLFSTGGAAIKAAALHRLADRQPPLGRRRGRHPAADAGRRAAAGPGAPSGGRAYATCLTLFVLANRLTTAANTIYLQSTAPLYLLVLSPWLLKEPIRRKDLGFMAVVGARAGALLRRRGRSRWRRRPTRCAGNLLALASGFFWALTVCGLRWMGTAARAAARRWRRWRSATSSPFSCRSRWRSVRRPFRR